MSNMTNFIKAFLENYSDDLISLTKAKNKFGTNIASRAITMLMRPSIGKCILVLHVVDQLLQRL